MVTRPSAHTRAKLHLWRCVRRGTMRLDKYRPTWREQVTRPLDMAINTHCVVGQTAGRGSSHFPYTHGLARLGLNTGEADRYGYSVYDQVFGWRRLTSAWRRVVSGAATIVR
jgi:hypothetical protein